MFRRVLERVLFAGCVALAVAPCARSVEAVPELEQAWKEWRKAQALERQAAHDWKSVEQQEQAYETTETAFKQALKSQPANPRVMASYAGCLICRREYVQARTWLEAAVE